MAVEVSAELLCRIVESQTAVWKVDRKGSPVVVSVEGSSMSVVCSSSDVDALSRLHRSGMIRFGKSETLPKPFDDKVGARLVVTLLGKRSAAKPDLVIPVVEVKAPVAQEPKPAKTSVPRPTKTPVPKPRTAPKRRKSLEVRVRMMVVRQIDQVCRYCLDAPAETADHVVPVSRGGSDDPFNLVGCCQECNTNKDDMFPKEAGMVLHVPLRWSTANGLSVWR